MRQICFFATLLGLTAILACGGTSAARPTSAPTPAASLAQATLLARAHLDSSQLPFFTPRPCEGTGLTPTCGFVDVLEDRGQPDGRTIRLAIIVLHSTSDNPAPDPVFFLAGGPGEEVIDYSFEYATELQDILEERDLILMDQRGVGYSQVNIDCRKLNSERWRAAGSGMTLLQRDYAQIETLKACYEATTDLGIDLSTYNSAASAADINDIRAVLGYDKINLVSGSYGTRLAQTVMRDYPEILRSVVLDSPYPIQANRYAEEPRNVYRAYRLLFDACAADAPCNSRYPGLEAVFLQTITDLNEHPIRVQPDEAGTPEVTVDGPIFAETIFRMMYHADQLPAVPATIYGVHKGDTTGLAKYLPQAIGFLVNAGVYYSVQCHEELPFLTRDMLEENLADLPPVLQDLYRSNEYWFTVCDEAWPVQAAGDIEDQPVTSDVPALILAGEYDPITPPAWGGMLHDNLPNSFFYEFPDMAHSVTFSSPCALEIILEFLHAPSSEPDTGCIANIPPLEFQ